jgi:hypothetical protein
VTTGADGSAVSRAAVSSAVVSSATAELYTGLPEQFTERRKALAAAARAAGDRDAARQIAALRKPTRTAWVVNGLAHAEPGMPASLADLAAGLRAAEQAKDGARLRALTARRRALLDSLAERALSLAGLTDPPPGLREEVTATLAAALADPEVAAGLAAGTLTRAATWSGFGLASQGPPGDVDEELPAPPPAAPLVPLSPAVPLCSAVPPSPVIPLPPQVPRMVPQPRGRRPDPAAALADAERSVATAAAIAAQSAASEERLEVRVRDLEQQLTTARAELADARMKARHAEAAERKARQALARLQSAASP